MLPFVRRTIVAACVILGIVVVSVGVYAAYLEVSWVRFDNTMDVGVERGVSSTLEVGSEYTAVTYNVGGCFSDKSLSYYRAEGDMVDGSHTEGKHAIATVPGSVQRNLETCSKTLGDLRPDFVLAQTVDRDSMRSHGVDQVEGLSSALANLSYAYAVDYHSPFLAYPMTEPQGNVNSGLLTMAATRVTSATRVSLPTLLAFPTKYLEPDTCALVERIPTSDGRELVLVNFHLADYDARGTVRERQLSALFELLSTEARQGNYVIAGGSLNCLLGPDQVNYRSLQYMPAYLGTLESTPLPEGITCVASDNCVDVPSMRALNIPYIEGASYACTSDGFLVSSNVTATATTVDTGFEASNHNPVRLTFSLMSHESAPAGDDLADAQE